MKHVKSETEIISGFTSFKDKYIVDVGCGTGNLVRWLTKQGAKVIGIDSKEMLNKAREVLAVGDEIYMTGKGEDLSLDNGIADIVIFFTSFHHIPYEQMKKAIEECNRVLNDNGFAFYVEPVAQEDSYYELTKLVDDESEIQKKANKIINDDGKRFFEKVYEGLFSIERKFPDYINLINMFIDDSEEREIVLSKAKIKYNELMIKSGKSEEEFSLMSICRLILLRKKTTSQFLL